MISKLYISMCVSELKNPFHFKITSLSRIKYSSEEDGRTNDTLESQENLDNYFSRIDSQAVPTTRRSRSSNSG
jgi:hypothetical protein